MGLLFSSFNIRPLREVEVNGEDQQAAADATTDYTATDNPPEQEAPQQDQNQETQDQNQNDQQEQDDQNGDDYQPTDYTEEDGQQGDEGEPPPEDGNEQQAAPKENNDQPVDDLKRQEEELYANLTPEQLDIKHKELKTQFLNMYDLIASLSEKINDAAVSEDSIGAVEYITTQLSELKEMLVDYINSVYQTKSYIENSINYNRFLAVLNGINKILDELTKKEE